jgi:hypothetical protein
LQKLTRLDEKPLLRDEDTDEAPVTVTEQATMRNRGGSVVGGGGRDTAPQRNATQRNARKGRGRDGGAGGSANCVRERNKRRRKGKRKQGNKQRKERKGTKKYMQCTHTQDTHAPNSDAK